MKTTIYVKREGDSVKGLPKEGAYYFDGLWFEPIELELPEDDEIDDMFSLKQSGMRYKNHALENRRIGAKKLRDKIKQQLKIDE